LGIEQSRRDDLEAIAYVLIYLLKGRLPWMGLKAENRKQKHQAISEMKLVTPIEVLCQNLPSEFATFLSAVRRLDFSDQPDYHSYRQLFRDLFVREEYVYDYDYDWIAHPSAARHPPVPVPTYHTEVLDTPRATLGRTNDTPGPFRSLRIPKSPIVKIPVVKQEKIVVRLSRRPPVPLWMNPPGVKIAQRAYRA
jgi:hypothetical protein